VLKSKYKEILQLLPKDYEKTLDAVQDSLTDDQICAILSSTDCHCANKMILDSLTERAVKEGSSFDIFGQLEELAKLSDNEVQLVAIITELQSVRAGKVLLIYVSRNVCGYICWLGQS